MRAPASIAALMLAAGCAPGTPAQPTWLEDVRPIVAANCIRCHGAPALGGAPATFRLDVLDDTVVDADRGIRVFGAASMAEYMAARTAHLEDMPPRPPLLSGRQKDIFDAWARSVPHEIGALADNHPPVIDELKSTPCDQTCTISVEVSDADRDIVRGQLVAQSGADPEIVIGELHGGKQELVWSLAGRPAGSYTVTARVYDADPGAPVVRQETIQVPRAVAGFTFRRPRADEIFVVDQATDTVTIPLEFDLTSVPAVVKVEVRHGESKTSFEITPSQGSNTMNLAVKSPTGACTIDAACPTWFITITYSDAGGGDDLRAVSPPFIVSRQTADPYASGTKVYGIVAGVCARCHSENLPSGPDFRGDAGLEPLRKMAGLAYRKVWQLREMPPTSTAVLYSGGEALIFTEDDRKALAGWLLAGAP